MKKLLFSIAGFLAGMVLFAATPALAQVSSNYWKLTAGTIQPNLSSWTLTLPYLPSKNCLGTDSNGLLQTGTCGGSGSSGLATTSPWTVSNLAYVVDNGHVSSVATTSASCSGTVSCSSFNVLGSSPITITGVSGSGTISTSTALVSGQVDFSTGVNTIGNDSTFLFDTSSKNLAFTYGSTTAITVSGIASSSSYIANQGSASAPGYAFSGHANDGVYDSTSGTSLSSGGNQLLWSSTKELSANGGTLGDAFFKWNNIYVSNASTTVTSATSLCLSTDCRTVWPSGGGAGLSTTSPIADSNLLEYSAAGAGSAYGVATSTPSIGTVLTYSGTLGNLVGGSSGTFSIANGAVTNAMLANSTISGRSLGTALLALTATDGSLTFSGSYTGAAARTVGLNVGNANTWTALQQFNAAASSTKFSAYQNAWFGATATSSFSSTGALTLVTPLLVDSGGTGQSTFTASQLLYGNGTAALSSVATSAPSFSGGLTTTGTAGAWVGGSSYAVTLANVNANSVLGCVGGAACTPTSIATSSLFQNASATNSGLLTSTDWNTFNSKVSSPWTTSGSSIYYTGGNVGVGTTTPWAALSVSTTSQQAANLPLFSVGSTTGADLFDVFGNGNVGIGSTSPGAQLAGTNNFWFPNSNFAPSVIGQNTSQTGATGFGGIDGGIVVAVATTSGSVRSSVFTALYNGVGGNVNAQGLNAFATADTGTTGNLTGAATNGGSLRNRYAAINNTIGYNVLNMAGVSAQVRVVGTAASTTNGMALNVESPLVNSGNLLTNSFGLAFQNAAVSGTLTNQAGIELPDLTAGTNVTNLLIGTTTLPSGLYSIYNFSPRNNYFGGRVGIGTTTPAFDFAVGTGAAAFYISTTTGEVVGYDATNGWNGRINPTSFPVLGTGTTTSWTASTTGTAYSPFVPAPFAGTLRSVTCLTDASFLGVNIKINGSNITPSYFIASTTGGIITFTANNTFTRGQKVSADFGTTTTATTQEVNCTFNATETP